MLGDRSPTWFRNWFMFGDPNPPGALKAAS
jgi:hypothetical protein